MFSINKDGMMFSCREEGLSVSQIRLSLARCAKSVGMRR